MKTPVIAALSIFLLVVSDQATAQTKMRLELGGGYASNTLSTGVLSNWEGGWSVNVAALYDLTACLQLTAKAGYQRHEYAGGSLDLISFRSLDFRREIDGNDTDVYELSFGTRFVDNAKIKLFFTLRGGLMWIDVGRISITQRYLYAHDMVQISNYPDSGELLRKGFVLVGSGFLIPITNGLNLVLESDLLSTFDRKEVIVPLTASVQIGLRKVKK